MVGFAHLKHTFRTCHTQSGKTCQHTDEWMKYIEENMDDALLTLEGEKMYVETIFREQEGNHEYLYWYSVQDG